MSGARKRPFHMECGPRGRTLVLRQVRLSRLLVATCVDGNCMALWDGVSHGELGFSRHGGVVNEFYCRLRSKFAHAF